MTTALERLLETPDGRKEFCIEQTITNVTELLWGQLEKSSMSQAELAVKMGVTPGRVSQLLDGRANLTLKTIARALAAFDQVMEVMSVPVASCGRGRIEWLEMPVGTCERLAGTCDAPARSPPACGGGMVTQTLLTVRGWVLGLPDESCRRDGNGRRLAA